LQIVKREVVVHPNSSIDKCEVEKFDRLSNKWWDASGEFKMLHEINPLRLQFIQDKIRQHFSLSNQNSFDKLCILDVGCGGGLISTPLAQMGANVMAIDASANNIKAAKLHARAQNLNIDYKNATVEELLLVPKKFDVVVCLEVIEHVANITDFIANLTSLLKPGGMMVLSTINRNIKSYLLAIIAAEYVLRWVPKHTHDHSKFLKPSELSSLLAKSNLRFQELKGLTFDIYSRTWKLSDNIDVNYMAYITS
jgi:2-polyprenyl-6-hydroxyphenyl methylase / 3-demethylubiquinone-9 3-methyltransferase